MKKIKPTIKFEACGYQCAVVFHKGCGHWCGYVGVSKDHPLFEVEYSQKSPYLRASLKDLMEKPFDPDKAGFGLLLHAMSGEIEATAENVITVHGGITFSNDHCPDPGNITKDGLWWFGFDCAHFGDRPAPGYELPGTQEMYDGATYRDIPFVKKEIKKLARQLYVVERIKDKLKKIKQK